MPDVLLADDNPSDVYLIREAFRAHQINCDLSVVEDGRDALHIISARSANGAAGLSLVILDLNLPHYDGIEILRRLRSFTVLANVPVVVLTSSSLPRDRQLAMQLGATRYLRKPSNLDDFLDLGAVFGELMGQNAVRRMRAANE
jgi:CheY-like chemotaxis protein